MVRFFKNKWPFLTKIVLTYCEKKLFWRPRICKIFEITRTIYSNSERSEQFLVTECFLTCSWRFLRSNKLEQLEFKLEKLLGFRNKKENLEKIYFGHIVIKRCAQYFSTTLLFQKCYLFQQVLKTVFKRYFLNVFWQLWTCCDLFWKSYDKFSPKKRCKRFRTKRFSEKLLTKQLVCMYIIYMTYVHK